jgi:hypothetical protein
MRKLELELEERDRRGYLAQPQREEEFRVWEDAAAWPCASRSDAAEVVKEELGSETTPLWIYLPLSEL